LYGALHLPRLQNCGVASDEDCASISLLFAARDEEEKLPAALETLSALDYPRLEIIAIDDRSTDATSRILAEHTRKDGRLRVVRVNELPKGWLGKPHALQKGYEASSGELLLFTDADVQFLPDTLRRAVSLFHERKLDHLTLLCGLVMKGFLGKTGSDVFCGGLSAFHRSAASDKSEVTVLRWNWSVPTGEAGASTRPPERIASWRWKWSTI